MLEEETHSLSLGEPAKLITSQSALANFGGR